MRFVSVRELRARPGSLWQRLREDEIVVTSNGRPRAVVARVDEEDLEALLREIRLARLRVDLRRLRAQAARSGAASGDERAAERLVRRARAARRR